MESTPVAAAVVQAAPFLFDTPRTLEKLVDLTSDAARCGANLVVFPEAFVGGYQKGLDFGARLGDCQRNGGQAAIAISDPGLALKSCPKPEPNLPLRTAHWSRRSAPRRD